MLPIDESSSGRQLDLTLGQTFEISLRENPSTGFRWILEASGEPICALIGDSFTPAGGSPGAGGVHRWRFEAVQVGQSRIALTYQRPWEQSKPSASTFTLRIDVAQRAAR